MLNYDLFPNHNPRKPSYYVLDEVQHYPGYYVLDEVQPYAATGEKESSHGGGTDRVKWL